MRTKKSKYSEKLRDPRWQKKRLEVFERDKWACKNCNSTKNTLNAHHLYYELATDPWEYPLRAFITLCQYCHEKERQSRPEAEKNLLAVLGTLGFLCDDLYLICDGIFHLYKLSNRDTKKTISYLLKNIGSK